jgi:hypothetical protein
MHKIHQAPQQQQDQSIPDPCGVFGCNYVVVLELKELPKAYLKVYVREGGWLFDMPCYDCKIKMDEEKGSVRVLDLAKLLLCKKDGMHKMACHCNHGVASHGMREGDEWKK